MPIHYEWADEQKTIMHVHIEAPWTWQQYDEFVDEVMSMIKSLGYPCATVVHTEKMGILPKDGNILQNLLHVDKNMPDNIFASAIVGTPMAMRIFMDLLTRLRPHAETIVIFAESTEDAHKRIAARHRERFPELAE